MSQALVKSIDVTVKVGSTPTTFGDLTGCSITLTPRILEAVAGADTFVARDVELMDWSASISVYTILAGDASNDKVLIAALAGVKESFVFTIPSSSPVATLTGDAIVTWTGTMALGQFYVETYELAGDGALSSS